jgi:hypothetical protein
MPSVILAISQEAASNIAQVQYASKLPNSLGNFLLVVVDLLKQNNFESINRTELLNKVKNNSGKPLGSARLSQNLKKLTELGVFSKETVTVSGSATTVYNLNNFDSLKLLPEPKPRTVRRTRDIARRHEANLKNSDYSYLSNSDNTLARNVHDQIFAGILDAGMRLSGKDTRKEITTEIIVAKQPLTITTRTRTSKDDGIALMSDLGMVRILLSWARSDLASRTRAFSDREGHDPEVNQLDNLFSISAFSLTEALGLKRTSGANVDRVVDIINRLATTEYEVDSTLSPWFREKFSFSNEAEIMRFKFLNNLEVKLDKRGTADMFEAKYRYAPRYFTFSFDPRTFYVLAADAIKGGGYYLFNSHPELSLDRSGITQRFYNWARAYIGGTRRKAIEDQWFSIEQMHAMLVPSARLDNFRRYFLRAVEKKSVEGSLESGYLKALIYGYYVAVQKEESRTWVVNIQRDVNDPIVGLESTHQQMLRSELELDVVDV